MNRTESAFDTPERKAVRDRIAIATVRMNEASHALEIARSERRAAIRSCPHLAMQETPVDHAEWDKPFWCPDCREYFDER